MSKLSPKWADNSFVACEVKHEAAGNFSCLPHKLHVVASGQGPVQATLPSPVAGLNLFIKPMTNDLSVDTLTLVRTGAVEIDGVAANLIVASEKETIHLVSDGIDWFII